MFFFVRDLIFGSLQGMSIRTFSAEIHEILAGSLKSCMMYANFLSRNISRKFFWMTTIGSWERKFHFECWAIRGWRSFSSQLGSASTAPANRARWWSRQFLVEQPPTSRIWSLQTTRYRRHPHNPTTHNNVNQPFVPNLSFGGFEPLPDALPDTVDYTV